MKDYPSIPYKMNLLRSLVGRGVSEASEVSEAIRGVFLTIVKNVCLRASLVRVDVVDDWLMRR